MIQTFGPLGLTSDVAVPLTLRTDARWLYINNDSPYRILVSLADSLPSATDSLGGEWNFIIRPHSDPVIPVQTTGVSLTERQLNGISDYHGHLWMLPQDPGFLALSGGFSNRAECSVTAGGPFDEMPAPSATARQTDLSSQPRIITLPAPALETTPGGGLVNTTALPALFPMNGNNQFVATAGDIGKTLSAAAYVYGAHISVDVAGIIIGMRFGLMVLGPGQSPLANLLIAIYQGYIHEPNRLDLEFAAPRVVAASQPITAAGTYTARLYVVVDAASANCGIYATLPTTVYQDTQVITTILPVGEGNSFPIYGGFPPIY